MYIKKATKGKTLGGFHGKFPEEQALFAHWQLGSVFPAAHVFLLGGG